MANEKVSIICAVHPPRQFMYHKWVKNFIYNGFNLALDQYITVNMVEKSKSTKELNIL